MIKRRFVIGAAGLAALGGGGAAYAIGGGAGTADRQAFINDVAKRLNVPPDKLRSAFQAAFSDRLDAAVAAGKLTRAQADSIKQRVHQNDGIPFLGRPRPFFGGLRGPFVAGFDAAARYLGLTPAQLNTQLESGKSLAGVASARNKDLGGLKSAMEQAIRARLDTAVANKRISKTQENMLLSNLSSRIDRLLRS